MLEPSLVATILQLDTAKQLADFLDGAPELRAMAHRWNAVTDDGVLLVPGDEYILDGMVTACDLFPELSTRSGRGVTAPVDKFPECSLCREAAARYDAEVTSASAWGFMCEGCYRMNSARVLGTGVGQYLFTIDELTGPIRQVVDHIASVCWRGQ